MKKTHLIISAVVLTMLVACTKKPVNPSSATSTKPVAVDSCVCEQVRYRGHDLASTNPLVSGVITWGDTTYWKFPMKDTNTLCKGNYFSDTLRISYRQLP